MYLCVFEYLVKEMSLLNYIILTDFFYNRDGMCLLRGTN
jgi:hypothetical protein